MNVKHSKQCIEYTEKAKKAFSDYVIKYPNFCRACYATGIVTWNESVPYGMGSASMPMADVCDACMGNNKCPRCGEKVWTDDDLERDNLVCPKCGWNDKEPPAPSEPDDYCSCIQAEEDRLIREYEAERYSR